MDVEQTHNKQKCRGKLYALSEESTWEDTGTGHTSITGVVGESRRLIFTDEESGTVLHDRPIFPRDTYQLQGETIIVWEDPESQKDWALSFQDPDGTAEVWEAICGEPAPGDKRFLPLPKLGNLVELSRMLTCVPPSQREALAAECVAPRFVNALREVFHTAEDLNSEEALTQLWHITKGVFLLSNQKLTERYLKQDVFEDVLGMLEYDSGLPLDKRIPHRQVLKVKVQFNQVIPFEDQATLDRIHLNYRLQYLKDIVLPRLLDDASFVSLTQMIHANISIILNHLQRSEQLLEQLLTQVRGGDLQSLLFLLDACRLARQIPPQERQALYEKLVERHLFSLFIPFLDTPCVEEGTNRSPPRHLVVEILLLSALNDPAHLRHFLTADGGDEGRALLGALIRVMLTEVDQGVQGQAAEVLKAVLDPAALEPKERDPYLNVFYDTGVLDELVAPLRADASKALGVSACFGQQLVCELLAFAVANHGYRAKIYVMRHGLAQQAMRLMSAPQRFLQLAPIRLLRAIVGTKDEAYLRYLAKNGLFAPVMRTFQQNLLPPALGGNLLVSVTLELLEFIRVANLKTLVDHVCRKHGQLLQDHASKFKTLEGLLLKHQQNREYEAFPPDQHAAGGPISRGETTGGQPGRPGHDDDDSDDEAYFESLDDDEDSTAGAAPPQQSQPLLQDEPSGEAAHGDPEARRARLLAAAGHAFRGQAQGSAKGAPGSTGAAGLKGLLGSYDDEDDEQPDCEATAVAAVSGQETREAQDSADARTESTTGPEPVAPDEVVGGALPQGDAEEEPRGAPSPPVTAQASASETGVAEPGGKQETEDVEEAEAKGGVGGGERDLNHVSKRLKTSASVNA